MQCGSCAHENPERSKFCQQCGTAALPSTVRCAGCGTELPGAARFCHECGAGRGAEPAAQRQPIDYTPRHLAERILASRSALEGERKQVTVFLADVKSSMELSEELDPEDWHRILERFFEILAEGVHRFEGTVNQYTGDGIMALFGAPLAHEDHAQRACWAGLHLRDELRRYTDELRVEAGVNFSVRMGLDSGEVVVGKIGDDLRMDYTAQGHTVGLAQRMEQLAESGCVYLTEHTAKLVEGWFALRDLGPTTVKGATDPVRVFELEAAGRLRSRFDLSRARGLSRFIGRMDEMSVLEAALESAKAGEGQVVGVVAEAGTGKSRLCFEFAERCRSRGIPVSEAAALSHGRSTPFLPVVQLLRQTFEIEERDAAQSARQKIAGAVVLRAPEVEPELPLLFDFLGVPDPERPGPELSTEERERRVIAAVQQLVQARSERSAGVVVVEDLHWIDSASERFLAQAVTGATQSRTLLVLNFRPEYRAEWMQATSYRRLPLRALGPDDAEALQAELLGRDDSLAALRERIRERTQGNPFFIEEMVRNLAEAGHLEGEPGAYRLLGEPPDALMPDNVHALVAARIDRLGDEDKRVLQAAAVIGDRFDEPLLAEVLERPAAELAETLHRLVAAELVVEEALYPEREYAFRHPLTADVARRTQLADRRARLHAATAVALEKRHEAGPGPHAPLLARHWDEAGEALPAARWHRHAALFGGLRMAAETFEHWRRVRARAGEAPPSREADELGALARAQLLLAGARIGADADEMKALYEEGVELAQRAGQRATLGWLQTGFANYLHQTRGVVAPLLDDLEGAVAIADEIGDAKLGLVARYHLLLATISEDLEVGLRQCVDLRERVAREPASAELFGFAAVPFLLWLNVSILSWQGRIAEAEERLSELAGAAEDDGSDFARYQYASAAALLAVDKGDAPAALRMAAQLRELAAKFATPASMVMALSYSGGAQALAGHWDDAIDLYREALSVIRERGTVLNFEFYPLSSLVRALAEAGRSEEALALADEGRRLLEERDRATLSVSLLALSRAWALLRAGVEPDAIEAQVAEAELTCEKLGLGGALAQCYQIRAELASLCGDDAGRERWLAEAERRYAEAGASGHATRVREQQASTPSS